MQKQQSMKQKVEVQDVDTIKSKILNQANDDRTVDEMLIEFDEEQDSSLKKRLREWMRHRQELKVFEEQRLLAETVIDLDSLTLKKLIMKLDNLEKCLRELRKINAGRVL